AEHTVAIGEGADPPRPRARRDGQFDLNPLGGRTRRQFQVRQEQPGHVPDGDRQVVNRLEVRPHLGQFQVELRGRVGAAFEDGYRIERTVGTQDVFGGKDAPLAKQVQRSSLDDRNRGPLRSGCRVGCRRTRNGGYRPQADAGRSRVGHGYLLLGPSGLQWEGSVGRYGNVAALREELLDEDLVDVLASDAGVPPGDTNDREALRQICGQRHRVVFAHVGEDLFVAHADRPRDRGGKQRPGNAAASVPKRDVCPDHPDMVERPRVCRKRLEALKAKYVTVGHGDVEDAAFGKLTDEPALLLHRHRRVEGRVDPGLDDRIEDPDNLSRVLQANVPDVDLQHRHRLLFVLHRWFPPHFLVLRTSNFVLPEWRDSAIRWSPGSIPPVSASTPGRKPRQFLWIGRRIDLAQPLPSL